MARERATFSWDAGRSQDICYEIQMGKMLQPQATRPTDISCCRLLVQGC